MLKNRNDCVFNLIARSTTDVNCKDDRGRTLISCTLENLTQETMENIIFLIQEKKADINTPDREGWTPLHYACQKTKSQNSSSYYGYGANVDYYRLQNAISKKQQEIHDDAYMQLVVIIKFS